MRKSVGVLLAVVLLLGSSSLAYGKPKAKAVERWSTVPVLRGVWTAHMTSKDGGKTNVPILPAERLCKVGASKITMSTGDVYRVLSSMVTTGKNGEVSNVIVLDDNPKITGKSMWAISDVSKKSKFYLVQVFKLSRNPKEIVRFVVSVK